VLLAGQGDYAGAVTLWRALVAESDGAPAGDRAFLLGNLGYALYLQGEHAAAVGWLEQACVLDPHQPLAWEHLAAVLAATGDTDRALRMMKQARTLRTHDIRRDYGLTGAAVATAAPAVTPAPTPWPAALARTAAAASPTSSELPVSAAGSAAGPVAAARPLNLEISNGNGVRGMAAAWARRLQGAQWKSLRITNARSYTVPVTRIEYRGTPDSASAARALAGRLGLPAPLPATGDGADVRIVLGRDQRMQVAAAGPTVRRAAP
jgi:tetratricopeptide (TPR) repeat protein